MAKNIDPELKKIGSYLNLDDTATFVIPEYQRAYSWEIKHCDKLWQDLEAFIESGGEDPYFFGTIIINCQENDTKLSLIDGQQRTTTFILLCKALLNRIIQAIKDTRMDEESEELTYGLERKRDRLIKILYKAKDDEILSFLKDFKSAPARKIIENHSINELYKDDLQTILQSTDYQDAEKNVVKIKYKQKDNKYTNFFRNFKYFCTKLDDLNPSQVNKFADYVLDKSEIIEIRSWNIEQAITMFNSLNSDGMPLLDADIISAKLYSESGKDREGFNEKWSELKEIIQELEASKVTDIDGILMQYMHIRRAQEKAYISEKGSINVTTPGLRRYYTEENAELMKNPLSLTAQLLKVAKIWQAIQNYSIVALCSKFNENIKTYLVSYLFRYEIDEITEHLVTDFAEHLLKLFALLELVDTGYSSSNFKTFLFGLNTKIVDKSVGVEELKEAIHKHVNKEWSKEEIRDEAQESTKNSLVFLNEYIACKEKDKAFFLPEKYEIEHIMPRSGKNLAQIRNDAGIQDGATFLEVVNKLGNKMLLEENINRSIGNAWFRTKIQCSIKNSAKEGRGYKNSVFALPSIIISDYEDEASPMWGIEDINERTGRASQRIVDFIFEM